MAKRESTMCECGHSRVVHGGPPALQRPCATPHCVCQDFTPQEVTVSVPTPAEQAAVNDQIALARLRLEKGGPYAASLRQVDRALVTLAEQLAAARKDSERYQWQPIETAPKNGTDILSVAYSGEHRIVSWWGSWQHHNEVGASIPLIHERLRCWMPLPAPPSSSTGERPCAK